MARARQESLLPTEGDLAPSIPVTNSIAQWDLTVAQARAHCGKGQRGGAFLLDRETVLAVADRLDAGVELAGLVQAMAEHRREMLDAVRWAAESYRAVLEKYRGIAADIDGLDDLVVAMNETIQGLEAVVAEDDSQREGTLHAP